MVCSSAPHSQAAKEVIPQLYTQERKRSTPVRRPLSRTQALLGRVAPGDGFGRKFYFPTKVTFSCKVSNVDMSGEVMGKDHKRSHNLKCKTSPKENVLGLFQLPGCWTTLSCYRDDECGKIQ